MNIALFDFDGTITTKDSLACFIQYAVGKPDYYIGILVLAPVLATYMLNIIPNYVAKQKLFSYFFCGWELNDFIKIANQYSIEEIDKIIRPQAIECIARHQNQGDKVVVVSASMEYWLSAWCNKRNIDLLATVPESVQGKLTGKFASKNCHGIEKVNRIKQRYNLSKYKLVYAYGDSSGDYEMLDIAHKRYYKYF